MSQGLDGRDHNITGYPMLLAGAGVKKGFVYGATDGLGVKAVKDGSTLTICTRHYSPFWDFITGS